MGYAPEVERQLLAKQANGEPFFVSTRMRNKATGEVESVGFPATVAGFKVINEHIRSGRYTDVYVSQALLVKQRGVASNIGAFTHLWCDLDCYGMQQSDVVQAVTAKCISECIPLPSTFTSSGRGVYLKWIFKDDDTLFAAGRGGASNKLVKKMLVRLAELFAELSADKQSAEPMRVLRVDGSWNHKSGTHCKLLHDTNVRYSVAELKAALLEFSDAEVKEYAAKIRKEKRERKARVISLQAERLARRPKTGGKANFSAKKHAHDIINDLRKLAEIRWNGVVRAGFRDMFGHIAISALSTCTDADKMLAEAKKYICDFMPDDYISAEFAGHSISAISLKKSGKNYRYSTQRMLELLSITDEEMQHLTVLVSESVKYEKRIKKLHAEGVKPRKEYIKSATKKDKPWDILGISKTYYYQKREEFDAKISAMRDEEAKQEAQRNAAETAKEKHIADVKFMASFNAFVGFREKTELRQREARRKILLSEYSEMTMHDFYDKFSKQYISARRKQQKSMRKLNYKSRAKAA